MFLACFTVDIRQSRNKITIEQAKSRPRHSNYNGLAETKNGGVIRKNFGYAYIAQWHAKKDKSF